MRKTLIKSEKEYREFAFPICQQYNGIVQDYFGLVLTWECYDTDSNGNDLDEDGNIIPDDTPDTVEVKGWVKELRYPLYVLDWIEIDSFGSGVIAVEFVSIHDFPQ